MSTANQTRVRRRTRVTGNTTASSVVHRPRVRRLAGDMSKDAEVAVRLLLDEWQETDTAISELVSTRESLEGRIEALFKEHGLKGKLASGAIEAQMKQVKSRATRTLEPAKLRAYLEEYDRGETFDEMISVKMTELPKHLTETEIAELVTTEEGKVTGETLEIKRVKTRKAK